MINVLLCGISTDMCKGVYRAIKSNSEFNIVSAVDKTLPTDIECDFPVYNSFDEVKEIVDVIIDFSNTDMIDEVLKFALENTCALVEGTRGYSLKQKDLIKKASETIPVFLSVNISNGINATMHHCAQLAKDLPDYDIEIIEEHQAGKANVPSMTATIIASTINEVLGGTRKITSGRSGGRNSDEICIHSVRGGGMPGKTQIMFISEHESITLSHSAHDKYLFAKGAGDAALFIINKQPAIYNLADYYKSTTK